MLKRWISLDNATKLYYGISAVAFIYHILILTQIVDYKNAWGGQLQTLEQMYVFEAVSIILQILFIGIIYLKSTTENGKLAYKITKFLTFVIALLFLVNTVGNVFAIELFEKVVFTPLTLIASVLAFRIAIE